MSTEIVTKEQKENLIETLQDLKKRLPKVSVDEMKKYHTQVDVSISLLKGEIPSEEDFINSGRVGIVTNQFLRGETIEAAIIGELAYEPEIKPL